jgi:hypothetical protein
VRVWAAARRPGAALAGVAEGPLLEAAVQDVAVLPQAEPVGLAAALPSAALWVCRRDRLRLSLAPRPAARFARAMRDLRIASP